MTFKKVALVSADENLRQSLEKLLKTQNYQVQAHATPGRFLDALLRSVPDMVILEDVLPGISGWDLLKVLRENSQFRAVPVVMLSSNSADPSGAVRGLELGADDYLSRPLDSELLLAKMLVLLRRPKAQFESVISDKVRWGSLEINLAERSIRWQDRPVTMTRLEFDLLIYLVSHPNRVLTRGLIWDRVWVKSPRGSTRTIDKHIEFLRGKLGGFGKKIETVIGVGYRLRI